MKTLSYVLGREEEIVKGGEYYFGQLWDGNGDGEELLESGAICVAEEEVYNFSITEVNEDILKTVVKIV